MQGRMILIHEERCASLAQNGLYLGNFDQVTAKWLDHYAGQVQTIYLDPPFYTGRSFKHKIQVEEQTVSVTAYVDCWKSMETYVDTMRRALTQARACLTDDGTLFLHVDYRTSAQMRLLLDEVFGRGHFINEIIWCYESGGRSRNFFPRKHDTIFFYSKSDKYYFNLEAVPCGTRGTARKNHMRMQVDEQGRHCRVIRSGGKEYRYYDDEDVYPSDVWTDISHLQQRDPERTGYETQKPLRLLRRIIASATREDDLVADFFAGSGTTGVAAAQLGRRFLLGDQGNMAILAADTRLGREGAAYTLFADSVLDGATLEAEVHKTPDGISVHLVQFSLPDTGTAQQALGGLEAIRKWSAGFVHDGVFERRVTAESADAVLLISAGPDERSIALMVSDYLGVRRCFEVDIPD